MSLALRCFSLIITCAWMSSASAVAIFTFLPIFLMWSLHFTAGEIENPFGVDASDLDLQEMQDTLNDSLVRLLSAMTQTTPGLTIDSELAACRLRNVMQGPTLVPTENSRSEHVSSFSKERCPFR